jgi:hypothetical protein
MQCLQQSSARQVVWDYGMLLLLLLCSALLLL